MKRPGFFDIEEHLSRVSSLGDQLKVLSRTVGFEVLRPDLGKTLSYAGGNKDGRSPFGPDGMFKILVIQTLNNLSGERTEYLINDRLLLMYFLGLGLSNHGPNAKIIWLFRERLTEPDAIERLFNQCDATLVTAPKQRNINEEKADLRAGHILKNWQNKSTKLSHKDRYPR